MKDKIEDTLIIWFGLHKCDICEKKRRVYYSDNNLMACKKCGNKKKRIYL